MKKIIFMLLLTATAFISQAQVFTVKPMAVTTPSYGNALDTVVNTATKSTSAFRVSNWHTGVSAEAVVTKISGTVGGTLSFQGSLDGTNWVTIGSAATPTDTSANYSFSTTVAWFYYRVSYAGTGTMSASFKAFVMPY